MSMLTISLSEERLALLRARAERAGLTPEELMRQCIDELLDGPDERFSQAASYVLKKNAELYRRLA
jgi:hypothetical protein